MMVLILLYLWHQGPPLASLESHHLAPLRIGLIPGLTTFGLSLEKVPRLTYSTKLYKEID